MADILHLFDIKVSPEKVFDGITVSAGLDQWWTEHSSGTPGMNEIYTLDFGPGYIWKAIVTRFVPAKEFELKMTEAEEDWLHTLIGFKLSSNQNNTKLEFYHSGWATESEHYRGSSYCWAMYLRILKRYLEYGETVPYSKRLNV